MPQPARIPAGLTQRMCVEVRARAVRCHQVNIASWAATDVEPIPRPQEASV
jgi:hypothetical protein